MNSASYLHRATVEFEDVDSYGIAHHSKLICILERARVHFFLDHGIDLHAGDFQLVLVQMDLKFKAPAKMMDELVVELRVDALKAASLLWSYRLMRAEDELLVGQIKMASVGQDLRPVRFPDEVRSALTEILVP